MDRLSEIVAQVALDVSTTLAHNWPYLLASVVVASLVQVYVGTERLAGWLRGRVWVAIVGAVALGALTPFCSCGTTAVVLGALASAVPWAPVVAFMVSSPLTSPAELVYSTGLFGGPFAVTFFVAAIVVGLAAGAATVAIERSGFLRGQARLQPAILVRADAPAEHASARGSGRTMLAVVDAPVASCCTTATATATATATVPTATATATATCIEPGCTPVPSSTPRSSHSRTGDLGRALLLNGRRLAVYFLAFATLGYLIIRLVPTSVLTEYLGADSVWSVPLAATLGIPVYLNSDGSLPLVATFMDGGMGQGAALAFLMTGAGTSIGAISGMLVIARWKVVGVVVGSLWLGAVVLGYLSPLWLSAS